MLYSGVTDDTSALVGAYRGGCGDGLLPHGLPEGNGGWYMRHRQFTTEGSPGRRLFTALSALLLAGGIATVGVGLQSDASPGTTIFEPTVAPSSPPALTPVMTAPVPPSPPAPSVQAAPEVLAAPTSTAAAHGALVGPVLPPSEPATITIDILGVNSSLMKLGQEADGTVAVPPGDAGSPAGWYEKSPTPGELGSSVILGHVNSIQTGIGVFYRLHELKDADRVSVLRADGSVAVFEVYRVDTHDKAHFPTAEVYGNAGQAELRLITCGGYEPATGTFNQNTVAYARLISSDPAKAHTVLP